MNENEVIRLNSPSNGAPEILSPKLLVQPPAKSPPALSCDSHLHIIGPNERYLLSEQRVYTPKNALLTSYRSIARQLGLERCVFIQPSVYGNDNTVLLNALIESGPSARGVVVIPEQTSIAELVKLDAIGVRGIRLNLVDVRQPDLSFPIDIIKHFAALLKPLGWHIELLAHVDIYKDLFRQIMAIDGNFVFGHMGYISKGGNLGADGVHQMIALAQEGRAWIKMTGPYRLNGNHVDVIARLLIESCPDRLVWGSDWPHVMADPMPDDGQLMNDFYRWAPTDDLRRQILVANPAKLYGWPTFGAELGR